MGEKGKRQMQGDYIKLNRKILEWEWWGDIKTYRVFTYCLLQANWKERSWNGMAIERGSFPTSLPRIAKDCSLTENEVRTALKHLKSTGEITDKPFNKFRIITVSNYDLYQCDNRQVHSQITDKSQAVNRQTTGKSQANHRQLTALEEGKNRKKERKEEGKNNYQQIADMYNSICISYPKVQSLSDARKRALGARLRINNLDDFRNLFEKAEASNFLKGENGRDWSANFDWLIKDSNMAKVLDGNYDCKTDKQQGRQLTDDFFTGG